MRQKWLGALMAPAFVFPLFLPSFLVLLPFPSSSTRLFPPPPLPPVVTYGQMTSALFTLQLFSLNLGSFLF